jgi:two-component system sensor histidine kinase KdpD
MAPTSRSRAGRAEAIALAASGGTIAALVWLYVKWLGFRNPTIAALSFLLVVFVAAAQSTLRVAIAVSVISVACFNFFFLPPYGTFTIAEPQNWFALFTLLVASVLVSRLSSQVRARAREALARRDELARLFDLTRDILLTNESPDPIAAVARHAARRFGFARVSIFIERNDGWVSHHSSDRALEIDRTALDRVLQHARRTLEFDAYQRTYAGAGSVQTAAGELVWLVPLRFGTTALGLLALQDSAVEAGTRDAIAGIVAIAIERQQLLEERKEAEIIRRGAALRSALLASLSHDLRTPLTAVTVATNNLQDPQLSDLEKRDQLDLIRSEADRLNRLFANIVEMARIETHAITAEPDWVQPSEIVETARQQVGPVLDRHPVVTDLDDEIIVRIDPRLTSTAVSHLLENAAQYSPAGSTIDVRVWPEAEELRISVRDRGRGLAAGDLERVFDRFYRGVSGQQRFGTGMGLAITRGLVAAEGGRVWAENDPAGGARFTVAIPAQMRVMTGAGEESS